MNFKYLYIDDKKNRKKERKKELKSKMQKDTGTSKFEHRMR